MRARHAVEQGSIVVDRARKHAQEHDAVVLDPNDLTHRQLSLFVTDNDVPARRYRQPAASISNVAVGEPIGISAVVVQPQIPGRHTNSLLRAPRVGDRKIEANLEPIEGRAVEIGQHDVEVRTVECRDERETEGSEPTDS